MSNGVLKRRFVIDAEHQPDLPGMMLVTVEALRELGGSATIQELDEKVIELEGVTEAEQAFTMAENENRPRVKYYLAWARTHLNRGKALENSSHGTWALTETGEEVTTRAHTQAIFERVIQEERERARLKGQTDSAAKTAHEAVDESLEKAEDLTTEEWYRARFGTADVWVIAPGRRARFWEEFLELGIAAIGPDELGDLGEFDSREAIHSALIDKGLGPNPRNDSLAAWEFKQMKIGDILIAKKGLSVILGWGRVTGDYRYAADRTKYTNTRMVEWHPCHTPISLNAKFPLKTLTRFVTDKNWLRNVFNLIEADEEEPEFEPDDAEDKSYDIDTALIDLFVEEKQFRRIIDTIRHRKNLILQGPPGVGKTFIARRIAWCLIGREDSRFVDMVQFHQSYAYEDFVQGWRPTDTGGFTLRNGAFFEFCKRAEQNPTKPFVFIVDEINRGNLSKIFGEMLMLIEADKRGSGHEIALTYSEIGERFSVPKNVHILGLMNTADRSLAIVDYALRRRFAFETLEPAFGTPKFRDYLHDADVDPGLVDRIDRNLSRLNERIGADKDLGPGFQIGHSYFVPNDVADETWYQNIVDTQIAPLLHEYWFDHSDRAEERVRELRK